MNNSDLVWEALVDKAAEYRLNEAYRDGSDDGDRNDPGNYFTYPQNHERYNNGTEYHRSEDEEMYHHYMQAVKDDENGWAVDEENPYAVEYLNEDDDLDFSVDPEDPAYDEVHAIISDLPPGVAGKITTAYDAILSHRAKSEEEALQQLLGLLEDRANADEEDARSVSGRPDDSLGDVTDDSHDAVGSPPNDGRFPKGD